MGRSKINTIVVKFTLTFVKVEKLPLSCTKSLISLTWKRGLKAENRGETERVLCKTDTVTFPNQKVRGRGENFLVYFGYVCVVFFIPVEGFFSLSFLPFSSQADILCTLIQDVSTEKWKTKGKDIIIKVLAGTKRLGKGGGKKKKKDDKDGGEAEEERMKFDEVAGIQLNLVEYANLDKPKKETIALTQVRGGVGRKRVGRVRETESPYTDVERGKKRGYLL